LASSEKKKAYRQIWVPPNSGTGIPSLDFGIVTPGNSLPDFIRRFYQKELNEKVDILEYLIKNYNDGRRKSFYCLAVNLLKLSDFNEIIEQINHKTKNQDMEIKGKIKLVIDLLELKAKKEKIELKLRK
jgi:hypothetical protein